jgi:hypothetical protein
MEKDNPSDVENIKGKQDEDNDLQQTATKHPEWYSRKTFDQVTGVLCYTKPGDTPSNWKITLPKKLIESTVKWYHQVTGHPGSKRLYEMIRQRYHNCDLRRYITISTVTIAKGINWMENDMDFYLKVKFDPYHLRNVPWI